MKSIIIGIAGGTGSGKTTLTERLRDHFGADEVSVLNHDSYYKRHDELPYEERCKLNYDHPDAFDNDLLIQHLKELKAGRAIDCPVYDYANLNRLLGRVYQYLTLFYDITKFTNSSLALTILSSLATLRYDTNRT